MADISPPHPTVVAVAAHAEHAFSKPVRAEIRLLAGLGVEGDAHCGATVKHRSRVRLDPTRPNLRQVHLVHQELIDDLLAQGFRVAPGVMGENVTTRGIDLLALPRGTHLALGSAAIVEVTGLRNPCQQLNDYQDGLTQAVFDRDADGNLVRKAGIMAVVVSGGVVRSGDAIAVTMPEAPHVRLERV